MKINVLVIGAGAIGCLAGGRLAAIGHTVTLLGRAKLVEVVNAKGLHLRWADGSAQTLHPYAVENLNDLSNLAEIELVLFTVKSFDTASAAVDLAGRLPPGARVMSLQNGVGNEELLVEILPQQAIVAGSITLPVEVPQLGTIVVSKDKGGIGVSPVSAGVKVADIAQALREAGFIVAEYSDYRSLKWSKLLMNIISNAASAILDMPPGEATAQACIFNLELAAMRETIAVMRAQGLEVVALPSYPLPSLAKALRWLPNFALRPILRPILIGGRGDKLPSLQLELRKGRNQSEVTVLNQATADAARKAGVAAPVNKKLSEILQGIVAGKILWKTYRSKPEILCAEINE
ncbi:MAG TPA: 2-dehydropantoate 2-reductase [Chloroflexi bacterium]|nr:2-dehydropantoate 2-reductase [Chloroflexota bacterium]